MRIDNFLKGDWASICEALKKEGLDETMDGAKDRGLSSPKFLGTND